MHIFSASHIGLTLIAAICHCTSYSVNGQHNVAVPIQQRDASPQRRAIPPSQDPFYEPPEGFEETVPGTVLRDRRVVASFLGIIPDFFADVRQVLYRTSAVDGSAIAAVTTIFSPVAAKKDRFVTYNAAYDSACVDCSPSYAYRWGNISASASLTAEFLAMQVYLAKGFIVNSPDYEGPDAAFTAGRIAAMGVLDSMRAVQNFASKHMGLEDRAGIVATGYSGGGLATAWAAALQPLYAPELNIMGWAMGGVPANLSAMVEHIDNTLVSGFLPLAIAGLSKPSSYGASFLPLLDRILTDKGRTLLENARSNCVGSVLGRFSEQSIFDSDVQSLGHGLLTHPVVAKVLHENVLAIRQDETPTAPVFLYHGHNDEVVVYNSSIKVYNQWCQNGANISFINYAAGGHITTAAISIIAAFDFVSRAFESKLQSGCSFNTVLDDSLNPLALGLNLEPLLVRLVDFLSHIGRNDQTWLAALKQNKSVVV